MFLFSNGPNRDFVLNAFQKLVTKSKTLFIASPYVTQTEDLLDAALSGKTVSLLVGLNVATNPAALRKVFGVPNISIRYYTSRFHAKIYVGEDCALVGSANLTDGGLQSNREATVLLEGENEVSEVRALCQELWTGARVLTPEILSKFEKSVGKFGQMFDHNASIEAAVGRAEPPNIRAGSEKKTSEYVFLETLRRRVFECFKPAFDEVSGALAEAGLHRSEWSNGDHGSETNRFLNWVRLVRGAGDEWRNTPLRPSPADRRSFLLEVGKEWANTDNPRIADDYFANLNHLRNVFSSKERVLGATREHISEALMGIHAFEEQIRFIKGGYSAIIEYFWKVNQEDEQRVKKSLAHLLYGSGDFTQRLYDLLNFPDWKIAHFGESCALELSGTVDAAMCPPMNGRSAKGLRYLGFDVPAS